MENNEYMERLLEEKAKIEHKLEEFYKIYGKINNPYEELNPTSDSENMDLLIISELQSQLRYIEQQLNEQPSNHRKR